VAGGVIAFEGPSHFASEAKGALVSLSPEPAASKHGKRRPSPTGCGGDGGGGDEEELLLFMAGWVSVFFC